jgi:hypothetical protein
MALPSPQMAPPLCLDPFLWLQVFEAPRGWRVESSTKWPLGKQADLCYWLSMEYQNQSHENHWKSEVRRENWTFFFLFRTGPRPMLVDTLGPNLNIPRWRSNLNGPKQTELVCLPHKSMSQMLNKAFKTLILSLHWWGPRDLRTLVNGTGFHQTYIYSFIWRIQVCYLTISTSHFTHLRLCLRV